MVRILHFIYGLHIGGAESFLINIIKHLDEDNYIHDFALQDASISNDTLNDYIRQHKSSVHILPRFPKHIINQYFKLREILNSGNYDFVHIHMNAAINPVPLLLSHYNCGKTRFIIHSHNSSNNKGGIIGKTIHRLNSKLLIGKNVQKVACSQLAGKWMFNKQEYQILDNAVDANKFSFNIDDRIRIRKEFGIDNNTSVIGNVGRFVLAKNHKFMIELFASYVKEHPDTKLLLVGNGPLYENIRELASKNRVLDKIIFTGIRTDIPALLSAMDCFLFPSHFEGLAFVAIEAQASGLNIIASDTISQLININNQTTFISLNAPFKDWQNTIFSALKHKTDSKRTNPVLNTRFDLNVMIKQIKNLYSNNTNLLQS